MSLHERVNSKQLGAPAHFFVELTISSESSKGRLGARSEATILFRAQLIFKSQGPSKIWQCLICIGHRPMGTQGTGPLGRTGKDRNPISGRVGKNGGPFRKIVQKQ